MSRLVTWGPPLAWTAVVFLLSSSGFSADNTGGVVAPLLAWLLPWLSPSSVDLVHGLVRKAAHLTEYAVLAALWLTALVRSGVGRRRAAGLALAVAVLVAIADEAHQSTLPTRTGSVHDVVLDAIGALIAVATAGWGWGPALTGTTGLLLWIGAVGGLGALALGLAAGVGGGVLWVTVPVAALALAYRRRKSAQR